MAQQVIGTVATPTETGENFDYMLKIAKIKVMHDTINSINDIHFILCSIHPFRTVQILIWGISEWHVLQRCAVLYVLQIETQAEEMTTGFPTHLTKSPFLQDVRLQDIDYRSYGKVYRVRLLLPQQFYCPM